MIWVLRTSTPRGFQLARQKSIKSTSGLRSREWLAACPNRPSRESGQMLQQHFVMFSGLILFVLVDDDLAVWRAGLDDLFAPVAGRFPPGGAAAAGPGVCAGPAGAAGQQERVDAGGGGRGRDPEGMQRLLNRAPGTRTGAERRAGYVRGTGRCRRGAGGGRDRVPEEGHQSAGVQRQYRAPRGVCRTASWACSWPTSPARAAPWSTGSCTCRSPGPATGTAAGRRASPMTCSSHQARLARRCWPAWTPASRPRGYRG